MPQSYVASIGRFINMLANSVIIKTIVSIELNNVSPSQGLLIKFIVFVLLLFYCFRFN